MITGNWEETDACLEVEARDSGVFANGSDYQSGNVVPLIFIAWSRGLLWDIWPPLPPEAWLKETGLIAGSIPYFVKWPSRPRSALEASSGHTLGQFQV